MLVSVMFLSLLLSLPSSKYGLISILYSVESRDSLLQSGQIPNEGLLGLGS